MTFSSTASGSNLNLEMLVFVEGEKPESLEKNPQSKDENQQQRQQKLEFTERWIHANHKNVRRGTDILWNSTFLDVFI